MKAIYNKLLMLCCLSLTLWSCDKDEDRIIMQEGVAPILSSTQSNLVLLEADKAKDAVTFNWPKAEFGYNAAVSYTLQFDKAGGDFTAPVKVEVENAQFRTVKVGELNDIANSLEMEGEKAGEMQVRVMASVGAAAAPVYSDPISITVTPYLAEPPYATLYLVGAATEGDWDNNKATPMFRSADDAFLFTYTGYLKSADFKVLGQLGKWGPAWGMGTVNTDKSVNIRFRPTEGDADVPNFSGLIPAAGYYTITLDIRKNSLTVAPYDATGKPSYTVMGVLGEFNGWDATPNNDQLMTTTSVNPHIWRTTVTIPAKADANAKSELKIRVNNSWGTNWGAKEGNQEKLYGQGQAGGPNFKITPGKYLLVFNDLTLDYVFIPQN
ncbi:SusE domain-containing protein [Rufibacter immobilis]|nr:SusE domain-containing protein [Rufibacter immobilis]